MPRCRLLLTGFAPFSGWPRNPSGDLVRSLGRDASLRRLGVVTAVLPVHRRHAPAGLQRLLLRHAPEVLVMTGLAAGREALSLERTAVNCWRRIGDRGPGRHVVADGPDGLFSTLPLDAALAALGSSKAPVVLSETAGTYCCNLVLYLALLWSREGIPGGGLGPRRAGFVHLPATAGSLPAGRCVPCLPEEVMADALESLCRALLAAPGSRTLRRGGGTR